MKVRIKDIKVKNRVRTDLGDLTSLQESIMKLGLLHPIIVNEKYELIAGLRRLYACRNIGWSEIEAQIVRTNDELIKLEVEAHENLIRKDFNQAEVETVIRRRKELMKRSIFHKIISAIKRFFKWLISLFKKDKSKKIEKSEHNSSNRLIE
jgi:ParB family transcriptional regulator, chromosome partitioning protein